MTNRNRKPGIRMVYSYIRMSTKPQAKADRDSFQRQKSLAVDFCKENAKDGYVLDTSLDLHDMGRSGFTGDNVHRGRLGKFMELIDAGKIPKGSILAIESFDRLSRQAIGKTLTMMLQIVNKGVEIVTLKDGRRWNDESINDMGDLVYSLALISQANESSEQKSRWLKSAWKKKRGDAANKPITAVCPSWLKLNRKAGKFEEIEPAVKTVRRIFDLSKNGMGNESISKKFNMEGVPPIGRRAKSWHASVVARILINRAVLGEFQPHVYTTRTRRVPSGEPIKNYYPPIISDQLFDTVQYRQKNRRVAGSGRRGAVIRNLFSHIAKCGFCGASMVSVMKDSRYPELVCDNARRGLGCRYVTYPYPEFENSFLNFVKELDLASVVSPPNGKNRLNEEIETTRARLSLIETKSANLIMAIEGASSAALIAPLREKFETLRTDQIATEARLRELLLKHDNESTPVKSLQELMQLVSKVRTAPNANEVRLALREAIRACVEKVQMWPYEIVKPPPEGSIGWKERRELTAAGWSLTSEVQRVERLYQITFKNYPHVRDVWSHPRRNRSLKFAKVVKLNGRKYFVGEKD